MHILLLPSWYPSHSADVDGVFFRDQAHALMQKGHKVGVISVELRSLRKLIKRTGGKAIPAFQSDDGILTYRDSVLKLFSRVPYVKYWLWRLGANRMLKRYIAEQGMPDIIHAHAAIYAGKVAAEWRARLGIPVVLTEHSTRFVSRRYKPWQLRLARTAAKSADARVAVSPPLGEVLVRELGEDVGTWDWIPNVVASRFLNVQVNMKDKSARPLRILNLALMREKKGHLDLLEAFAEAFPDGSEVELWFGGDGPLRPQLEARTQALGLGNRVRFLGKVPPEEVPSLLSRVDMFVLPSHYETFGVVVAEALTVGVPVVATRCGGPECIVMEGDGVLVEPRAPHVMAKALKEQMSQLSIYNRAAIKERAISRFSGEAVANQLDDLYQLVLAE